MPGKDESESKDSPYTRAVTLRDIQRPRHVRHEIQSPEPAERLVADRVETTQIMPVSALTLGESPRLAGEDPDHTRRLAEVESPLPPILVHRATMRVIDGLHRVRAAQLCGQDVVAVRFFGGTEDEAFVEAVKANVTHGLPLSLADRKAAAGRILTCYPYWSDRAIGSATGLTGKTVAAIRRTVAGGETPGADIRVGRDGRIRPVGTAQGRRIAEEIISSQPDASLRAIARAAKISPATARDVRERMRRGEEPVRSVHRVGNDGRDTETWKQRGDRGRNHSRQPAPTVDRETILRSLVKDPSLRFSDSGRALLRWLLARAVGPSGWTEVVSEIPQHSFYTLANLGRACADEWLRFASGLEERAVDDRAGDRPPRAATA
jgi:hypothetical protein